MKLTSILYRQHIGFMFKKHWQVQGQRRVQETNAAIALNALGKKISDSKEFMTRKLESRITNEFDDLFDKPVSKDNNHPNYKSKGIYVYDDSNVLVQGVHQAQVLLQTIVLNELPERVEEVFQNTKLPNAIERSMQQSVLVSHLLDAEQQKTAKVINPMRPMRPYPRNYGITEPRKNLLLSTRLLNHCERFYGYSRAADRKIIFDAFFVAPFKRNSDDVQIEVTAETFMSSKKPIAPFKLVSSMEIPDIFPLKPTVSIPRVHFYEERNAYPINSTNQFSHPHTILLHFSNIDVKNFFETPVTADQFESRAMLKGFAVAASRAKSLYGSNVKLLEKPIVVQVVHFDSRRVQFGIFQLNNLDMSDEENVKNYWFRKPEMLLFEDCCYKEGRPALGSYNFDVFRMMSTFYNN